MTMMVIPIEETGEYIAFVVGLENMCQLANTPEEAYDKVIDYLWDMADNDITRKGIRNIMQIAADEVPKAQGYKGRRAKLQFILSAKTKDEMYEKVAELHEVQEELTNKALKIVATRYALLKHLSREG